MMKAELQGREKKEKEDCLTAETLKLQGEKKPRDTTGNSLGENREL